VNAYEFWMSKKHRLDEPSGRLQFKGTNMCMDFDCICGEMFHIDGDFVFSVKCPYCNRIYALDHHLRAVEMVDEFEDFQSEIGT
jgi:hypothetical protein